MELALEEARKGMEKGEVPIGAVIVRAGEVIASAHNEKELTGIATRHAEIVAIERASIALKDWRLNDCDMYVTVEPCPMCAGAIINSRVGRVFYGAPDPKAGCAGTLYNLLSDKRFNHRPEVVGGVLEMECSELISNFFKRKRSGGTV